MKNEGSTMKLSKNLSLAEVTKAPRLNASVYNVPDDEWVIEIFAKLQSMCFNLLGMLSGVLYTCRQAIGPELNRAIGGSLRSQHMEGRALDLDADVYGVCTNSQIFDWIRENVTFDQMV